MNALTDLDSRIRAFHQLRSCSDLVRTELIPAAVAGAVPTAQAFYEFINAYFKDDVLSGQLVKTSDIRNVGASVEVGGYYDSTIDDLASVPSHTSNSAGGFQTLHPRYLRGVSEILFNVIDTFRVRQRRGDLDLDFLVVVHFCLQLAHFAKDGTGRVGEDILVLLAAESDRTLTFSPTGYRGALEGPGFPLFYVQNVQTIFYFEVVCNFFRFLGLPLPTPLSYKTNDIVAALNRIGLSDSKNRLGWPDGLGSAIAGVYEDIAEDPGDDRELFQSSMPYRLYAKFLSGEIIYFTLCLKTPSLYLAGVKARYPSSFACSQYSLELALGRTYHPIPDGIGEDCDEAVALIESLKLGRAARDANRLETAVVRVETEDAQIGRLFRHELSTFLTDEEEAAFRLNIPRSITGAQLDEILRAGMSRARSDQLSDSKEPTR